MVLDKLVYQTLRPPSLLFFLFSFIHLYLSPSLLSVFPSSLPPSVFSYFLPYFLPLFCPFSFLPPSIFSFLLPSLPSSLLFFLPFSLLFPFSFIYSSALSPFIYSSLLSFSTLNSSYLSFLPFPFTSSVLYLLTLVFGLFSIFFLSFPISSLQRLYSILAQIQVYP